MNAKTAPIHFRRLDTREIVSSFDVKLPISTRALERILLGAMRNMHDDLYIDDSEVPVTESSA